jgi:hypothetical protein
MVPDMSAQAVRPSQLWYWVAGAAAAAAVIWLAVGLVFWVGAVDRQVEQFQRVPIPGRAEVTFTDPGGYILYFEGAGAGDEQVGLPAFDVSLTSADGGESIPIRSYGSSLSYHFAGRSGRAVGTFQIDRPGRFVLQTEGAAQAVPASAVVGPSIGGDIIRTLALTVPGPMILFLAGILLAVVVAVRRSRARTRLAPAAAAVAVQPGAPGPRAAAYGTAAYGAAPAGWFADPSGRHQLRYWDGQRWTAHVSDSGTQSVDALG